MGWKDFKKGVEAGAKPFEAKFKQQAEAIDRVSNKIEDGIKKIDGVVEEVIDGLSSIEKKQLYDLNTQFDIYKMEDYEKELLLASLFTLAKDVANENQQSYIRSVKTYLDIKNPQTEIDLSGIENIENLNTQKAMFQTFVEFLFLEKEDDSFWEEYEELFDLFSIKKKDKDAIYANVLQIYKAVGAKGLCEKYGFVVDKKSIKAPAVVDSLNMTLIESAIEIAADEEKTFSEQKIRLLAPIVCNGKLNFERCVIIYNSKKLGENIISCSGATITLSNCTVVDKKEKYSHNFLLSLGEKYSHNYFLLGKGKSNLICDNTLFYNCESFASDFNTKITDCVFKYTDLPINHEGVLIASEEGKSEIKGCLFENTNLEWVEENQANREIPPRLFKFCCEEENLSHKGLIKYFDFISNCTFKNLYNCAEYFDKVEFCHFINCVDVLKDYKSDEPFGKVLNCLFENSFNVIDTVILVSNCQFIGCRQNIISIAMNYHGDPVRVENCSFYNSSMDDYKYNGNRSCLFGNPYYCPGFIYFSSDNKYYISDCIFDGINCHEATLGRILDIHGSHDNPSEVTIKNCSFKNCVAAKEPIKMGDVFFTGVFNNKRTPVKYTEIINCKGLENINKEGKEAKNIPIQMKAKDGTAIGSSIEADDIGIGGFDPAEI